MAKVKTHYRPTSDEIRTFLSSVDADHLIASAKHNQVLRGIQLPEDVEACKRVYKWLREYALHLEEAE